MKKLFLILVVIAAVSWIVFWSSGAHIKLATTTSTENSGLLDYLLPQFTEQTGVRVDVIATGTGKALKLGEKGDVDIVLVHAREAEESFVASGFGIDRHDVMYNDFIIVGPKSDPIGLSKKSSVKKAFASLAKGKASFISRSDNSGTHMKEMSLWKMVKKDPEGEWYFETGQGMGLTLKVADEKQAYCLVDRGTYLAFKDKIGLVVLFENSKELLNTYGVIAVSPELHKHVKYEESTQLIDWLISAEGQKVISEFRLNGEELFHPVQGEKDGR